MDIERNGSRRGIDGTVIIAEQRLHKDVSISVPWASLA